MTTEAAAEPKVARRTTRKPAKAKPMPPEEFFANIMVGIVSGEGVAGLGGSSTVNVLSNPQNAPRWYAAYLAMNRNWNRFLDGEIQISGSNCPAELVTVLEEIVPDGVRYPPTKE